MKNVFIILLGFFAIKSATAQTVKLGRSTTEITMEVEIDAPIENV
jgi:hypothetical protein